MRPNLSVLLGSNAAISLFREMALSIMHSIRTHSFIFIDTSNLPRDLMEGKLKIKAVFLSPGEEDFNIKDVDLNNEVQVKDLLNYSSFVLFDVHNLCVQLVNQARAQKLGEIDAVLRKFHVLLLDFMHQLIFKQIEGSNQFSKMRVAMDAVSFSMIPMGEENRQIVSMVSALYSELNYYAEDTYLMVSANHFVKMSNDFSVFCEE